MTDVVDESVRVRGHASTVIGVELMSLRCSHFDAYRFFTEDAVGRNLEPLSREPQVDTEQPGCLHAAMDLYKWAYKLAPLWHRCTLDSPALPMGKLDRRRRAGWRA